MSEREGSKGVPNRLFSFYSLYSAGSGENNVQASNTVILAQLRLARTSLGRSRGIP